MADRADTRPAAGRPRPPAADASIARFVSDSSVRRSANAARHPVSTYPELDCVRNRLPLHTITATERRARELGVTADHVLLTSGLIDEETYVRALAHSLGLAFEPLDDTPRARCPLDDARLIDAQATGLLPLRTEDELALVIAPRGIAARRLFSVVQSSPGLHRRARLTTDQRLRRFVERHGATALGERAAFRLLTERPEFSAAPRNNRGFLVMLAAAAVILAAAAAAPGAAMVASGIVLSVIFLAWTGLRLLGVLAAPTVVPALPRRPADTLPACTIIVALYREAKAVRDLVASLDALDWPGIMAQTPRGPISR